MHFCLFLNKHFCVVKYLIRFCLHDFVLLDFFFMEKDDNWMLKEIFGKYFLNILMVIFDKATQSLCFSSESRNKQWNDEYRNVVSCSTSRFLLCKISPNTLNLDPFIFNLESYFVDHKPLIPLVNQLIASKSCALRQKYSWQNRRKSLVIDYWAKVVTICTEVASKNHN